MSRPRWVALGAVGLAVVALLVGAAVYWHFSSAVLVPDHSDLPAATEVEAVAPGQIELARSTDSERPGVYGLDWQAGHALAGAVLRRDEDTVTRRLRAVDAYLAPGMKVALDSRAYAGDPRSALGLPFATVAVPDELGPMPAWLVPARGRTWAIVVHGINSDRQTGLRILPALHRAGLPAMVISYREDLGAPSSPDGLHHMGLTEWRDLGAAARYALAHGARRLLLVGYSMGGAVVTQFMQRSPLVDHVAGLVLDAPVLDWRKVLEFNATQMGFPAFAATPVEWTVGARIDADWESLDALDHLDDLRLPILLFHGDEDDVVPVSNSDELAERLPREVTYYRVPKAGHTESWNVGPRLYERRLSAFLRQVAPLRGGAPQEIGGRASAQGRSASS